MELARPEALVQRRCALYRHYDDADVLLYVGITDNLGSRTNSGHALTSDWVQYAERAEAEWHNSREDAASAERDAVREERPIFNRQYAEWDVDRQVAEYVQQRELRQVKAVAEEYEVIVRRFLGLTPAVDVNRARDRALVDYRHNGMKIADPIPASLFPVYVLRHLANAIEDRATNLRDEARSEAFGDVLEFLRQQLEEIRSRAAAADEPPF